MKLNKVELRKMIKGVLLEVLTEAEPRSIPQTQPTDPAFVGDVPAKPETPAERKRRLRQKFKQQSTSETTDIGTQEGRENILDRVYQDYGDIVARLNIIMRLANQAMTADTRQNFKTKLIQIYENLEGLQQKELPKVQKSYTEVLILTGLKKIPMAEMNLNPDTPVGRRNLARNILITASEVKSIAIEGEQMLKNARNVTSVSVFLNELKALGKILNQISQKLIELNRVFVETFKEYERQRGR